MPLNAKERVAFATLKGEALRCAIKAGMVRRGKDGEGYDIAPFLAFWDLLSPHIELELRAAKEAAKEAEQLGQGKARRAAYESDGDVAPQA